MKDMRAGGMDQWFRTLDALEERIWVLFLVSISGSSQTPVPPNPRVSEVLFWPLWTLQAHGAHSDKKVYTHQHNKYINSKGSEKTEVDTQHGEGTL